MIRRMLSDRSKDAPAGAIKYAKDLYRARASEPKTSAIQRILAVIRVDLAPNKPAFGERSAGTGQARQMLFDTGDNAVDLRITPVDKGFNIRGQVLGTGCEQATVYIAGKLAKVTSILDPSGGFRFEAMPAGKYSLSIRCGVNEIVIESLVVE